MRTTFGPRRAVAALLVTSLVLVACSDDDEDGDGGDTTEAPSGSEAPSGTEPPTDGGGEGSVVVGAVLEPTNLDIISTAGAALDQVLLDNVYETLVTYADGAAAPGLAELPEVSEDGLTYTFTLQEGVTFHDGDPLTASDVVWSLEQSRGETAVAQFDLASVASVTAVDDATVEITLSERDNWLLFQLSRRAGVVLNEGATDLQTTANGTGPFTLGQVVTGDSITLERFDGYWGDPAGVAEVTFRYFTDPQAAVNALTAGEADMITGANANLIGDLVDDPEYEVIDGASDGEFTLGFNNRIAPFDDPAVRTALRQAIDKEGVLELAGGYGQIIGGPVPPTDPWYTDLTSSAPFDPAAAQAAIEAAGVTQDGAWRLVWPNFYPIEYAEFVATSLGDIGLEVEVVPVEFSVWLEQVFTNGDYEITAVLHVEPRDITNYANPDYYWGYDSAEVQQLVGEARVAETEEESNTLLREASQVIAADSPVDWLLLFSDLVVASTDIEGYPRDFTNARFDASNITIVG
ncbi:MAG: ABC transporter substrate-binding protein [Ilumatobacteraceae bacterium]|jgi:peptide/nickel transport system substrate-binding protein|nr:ABC transporter substrate-binding protein [Ilumatobacteraceae bacterium]